MKLKNLSLFLSLLLAISTSFAGVVVVEGTYQGKNLYIQNPFAGSGIGFCVFETTINGNVTTDEINSSAFEIDFAAAGVEVGQSIILKLKHKDDCRPKVLNGEVLKAQSTFSVISINAEKNGVLSFVTKDESGSLPFTVEQFRWNKWIKIGEVIGKGTAKENTYSIDFNDYTHSGLNQFRVKQIDFSKRPNLSSPAKFRATVPEVTIVTDPKNIRESLQFSSETMYEVYDQYGSVVKKGKGVSIQLSGLDKGTYYLNYDNKADKFDKRK